MFEAEYTEGILWLAVTQKLGRLYAGPADEDLFMTNKDKWRVHNLIAVFLRV